MQGLRVSGYICDWGSKEQAQREFSSSGVHVMNSVLQELRC